MNLMENEELNEKRAKSKKIMIIIIVLIVLLLIVSGVLLYMIYNIQRNTLKLTIDNQRTNFASDTFVFEDDKLYVDIRAFAQLMGYESYNADYKNRYSEDATNCYINSPDEIASYSLNSNTMYKKATNNEDYEYFDLEEPVRLINNKLYVIEEGIEIGTNSEIQYNPSNNQISVLSLDYIVNFYASRIQNSALIDDDIDFNNKKALRYDLVVVKNSEGYYGVSSTAGQEVIGTKYTSLVFKEDSREFTVTTNEGKMGILSADGTTKIEPNYTEIKQISKDLNYYLVSNNNRYGVINQNGNTVIFLEYDKIGIDENSFNANGIENPYILFDKCIPVQQNGKWRLFDISGNQIGNMEYDEIGCTVGSESNRSTNNVLIVPQYEAIVVGVNDEYGIISTTGEQYVPIMLDSVYSITSSGEEIYYMTFTMQVQENGEIVDRQETYNLDQYFEEHIIETPQAPELNTNTIANETTANTVDTNSVSTGNGDTNSQSANITTNVAQ